MNNNITLVIPTFKGSKFIVKTLRSIFLNKIKPNNIIIVDQNKDFSTYKKTQKVFREYNFKKYKFIKLLIKPSLTKAKNKSLKYIKTDKVIFLDDDMILHKDFFFNSLKYSRIKKNIISGVIINQNVKYNFLYNIFFHNIFKDNRKYFFSKNKLNILESKIYVAGGISIYDRNIFKKIKFDEKKITHNYEDVDFCIRLKSYFPENKFLISKNMKTYEQNTSSGRDNITRRYKFLILLFNKHRNKTNIFSLLLAITGLFIKFLINGSILSLINKK